MIIYKTTNLINNKFYIGQDKHNNPDYYGSGIILKEAIKKYGKENFQKEILEECSSSEFLNDREIYWIDFYNSTNREIGYNITRGGDGGDTYSFNKEERKILIVEKRRQTMIERYGGAINKGKSMNEEQKQKVRISKTGQKYPNRKKPILTEEHKEKISIAHKERYSKLSEEEKEKLTQAAIQANTNSKRSEESRKKMSEAAKRRYSSMTKEERTPYAAIEANKK